MNKKITTDLSKLSNIPEDCLERLFTVSGNLISNAVYEGMLAGDSVVEVDLVFGKLIIKTDLQDLKIKFIPSEELEIDLKGINNGEHPILKTKLEKSVIAKLIGMYKELI